MKEKYYKAKGWKIFFYSEDDIYAIEKDKEYYSTIHNKEIVNNLYEYDFKRSIYDLFTGEKFLKYVQDGSITNYDGHEADVFVDGFRSNLGLLHENIQVGGFLVDEDTWLSLCKEYQIEVNWANK